jgi:mannose-1-phosphate guanylyltransferase/mannose-6-phosphate isomerase
MRRDSGPAIAAGAVFAQMRSNEAVVLALAADHVVGDTPAFVAACREGLVAADAGKMHRRWGSYQSVNTGERHQVKRIVVKPGGRLSLRKHHHRSEHWIVLRGAAWVTVNELVKTVHENESIYIPIGSVHRLENPGKIQLELIEVQTGSYLGEDDIIRIEDDYKRS